MFKSSDWVVHLFSGERRTGVQQRLRDFVWNASLVEDDVLVEIDVTQSKSFDLTRQKGVFQLLCWAASQGKLKALVGGPPRRSMWHDSPVPSNHSAREAQLVSRMLVLWTLASHGRLDAWRAGRLQSKPQGPAVGFALEYRALGQKSADEQDFFDHALWKGFFWVVIS